MQVQHHACARRPGRRQRPPAETRQQIVRVHDARAAETHRSGDLVRVKPSA